MIVQTEPSGVLGLLLVLCLDCGCTDVDFLIAMFWVGFVGLLCLDMWVY